MLGDGVGIDARRVADLDPGPGAGLEVDVVIARAGLDEPEPRRSAQQRLVDAQMLGLRTCWVGLSYKKIPGTYTVGKGEKLVLVIALGYGAEDGRAHRSKKREDVSCAPGDAPEWFTRGVNGALLAPTAVNQQKFFFELQGDKVSATAGRGFFSKVDLGIVKYHFEIASGRDHTVWE